MKKRLLPSAGRLVSGALGALGVVTGPDYTRDVSDADLAKAAEIAARPRIIHKEPMRRQQGPAVPLAQRFNTVRPVAEPGPLPAAPAAPAAPVSLRAQVEAEEAAAEEVKNAPAPAPASTQLDLNELGLPKPVPLEVRLVRKKTALRIVWRVPQRDGDAVRFTDATTTVQAELLRVVAPSTDVLGSPEVVQYGKRGLGIANVIVVGNYALRIHFTDGHDAGIFPYGYLHEVGTGKWRAMRAYIQLLRDAHKPRDKPVRKPRRAVPASPNSQE